MVSASFREERGERFMETSSAISWISKNRKFAIFLLTLIYFIFFGCSINVYGSNGSNMYRAIDLYTQKEPYSGRGPNQPADAFAPQEEVILYAYVTYRDDPVPGKLVSFQLYGPSNSVRNLSITLTSVTNMNGIANVSFRMMTLDSYPEETIFGIWTAVASVDIAGVVVSDTLTFNVGWIVQILDLKTVDKNNVLKVAFMKNESLCFRITVKNIAITSRIATLIIEAYDNLSVFLGKIVLPDKNIEPGITVLFIPDIIIPESASLGEGIAFANAYTRLPSVGGIPWCPQVSTKFLIVKKMVHDVAVVNVIPSPTTVRQGEFVKVSVCVINYGNTIETFNVSAYYDFTLIGTSTVRNLNPNIEKSLMFYWNTSYVNPGNYTISAMASIIPGEVNIDNNRFVDGVVEIKPLIIPPPPVPCVIPRWLIAFLFVIAVLVGLTLGLLVIFILLWLRRRKEDEEEEVPISLPAKPSEGDLYSVKKKCNVCGREFLGVYTFCPYCMSFHGKDYE